MDAICDNSFVPKFCCLTNEDWCVSPLIKKKKMTLKHNIVNCPDVPQAAHNYYFQAAQRLKLKLIWLY